VSVGPSAALRPPVTSQQARQAVMELGTQAATDAYLPRPPASAIHPAREEALFASDCGYHRPGTHLRPGPDRGHAAGEGLRSQQAADADQIMLPATAGGALPISPR
jgi:hypothetical protein